MTQTELKQLLNKLKNNPIKARSLTSKELKEKLDKERNDWMSGEPFKFEGFVLDKPIKFSELYKDKDLDEVNIVLIDELLGYGEVPSILDIVCGEFAWKNNQIVQLSTDKIYIHDKDMLVYASEAYAKYDETTNKVAFIAYIYVKSNEE